jgi:ribonuclease HII
MPTVLGIDEAGRGPVIGSLFIAAVVIEKEKEENLKNLGVKDSKMLTPLQRERLYESIVELATSYKIIQVSPQEIDGVLHGADSNLNWLEADKSIELINALETDEAVMDCPSTNIEAFSQYIKNKLNKDIPLLCAHKADQDHPSVAAASILAKVERDKEIREIKQKIGVDFGSGYPSDPKTVAFLKSYWDKYPEIFRHSWKSYKNVAQKTLDGF